jgi:hypothetical protein
MFPSYNNLTEPFASSSIEFFLSHHKVVLDVMEATLKHGIDNEVVRAV